MCPHSVHLLNHTLVLAPILCPELLLPLLHASSPATAMGTSKHTDGMASCLGRFPLVPRTPSKLRPGLPVRALCDLAPGFSFRSSNTSLFPPQGLCTCCPHSPHVLGVPGSFSSLGSQRGLPQPVTPALTLPRYPLDPEDYKILFYSLVYSPVARPPTLTPQVCLEVWAHPPRYFHCSVSRAQRSYGEIGGCAVSQ